jgi:serine/threonine protein phosphatase PrpC
MQKIQFFGKTDMGKLRTNNEDNLIFQHIWDDNHVLGVAIDGVGGYEGGEVAAEIAKTVIVEYLKKYPNGERLILLKQAVTEANNCIFEESQKQLKFSQMSCVLSAVLVEVKKKQINMVHVGDSRFYQFHNGILTKLSHDHSHVGYREDMGDLTEEEAMNHPKRNEISRLLGDQKHQPYDRDFIEAKTFPLLPNSILLLCSDGLTDLVTKVEMREILTQTSSLEQKVQDLIDKANEKGGKDNITVVLIDYQSEEDIENGLAVIEHEELEINQDNNKTPEKKKRKKKKLPFAVLIAVFALLIGASSGWFAKGYLSNENNKDEPASTFEEQNGMLKIDELNLADTAAVKQYIQNLNDTIRQKEQKIDKLNNVIRLLTETE